MSVRISPIFYDCPRELATPEHAFLHGHTCNISAKMPRSGATLRWVEPVANGNLSQLLAESSAAIDPDALRDLLIQMGVQFKPEAEETELRPEVKGDSVIKIFATSQEPDYTLPWQTLDVTDARGSGVVIEGGRILTAARTCYRQSTLSANFVV
jgi:hypothetical protein